MQASLSRIAPPVLASSPAPAANLAAQAPAETDDKRENGGHCWSKGIVPRSPRRPVLALAAALSTSMNPGKAAAVGAGLVQLFADRCIDGRSRFAARPAMPAEPFNYHESDGETAADFAAIGVCLTRACWTASGCRPPTRASPAPAKGRAKG